MDDTAGLEMTATSNGSGSNDKRQFGDIKKACVILADGETEDTDLVRDLTLMGLCVQFCNTSQVELQRNNVNTIIVQDFSSFLETRDQNLLYYGPTCIKREAALTPPGQEPQLPFSGHSMLTTLLMNYKLCLQVRKNSGTLRARIYALGGRLSKTLHEADLLITSYASGAHYRLAQRFTTPVVNPAFIDALWEKRDSLDFKVTPEFIEDFRLPVFSGLKMHFYGFESGKREKLIARATANGAAVAGSVSRDGTYIIVVDRNSITEEELQELDKKLAPASLIVYEPWFHDSIHQRYALCEKQEEYNARDAVAQPSGLVVCSPQGRRKRNADASPGMTPKSKKSMESLLMSPRVEELSRLESCSGVLSPSAGAASPIRAEQITDRRHLILLELRDTERNYLAVLRFIMKMVHSKLCGSVRDSLALDRGEGAPKEGPPQVEKEIITRFERQEIFKEIPNIIRLHEVLLRRIEDALCAMDFKNIAAIFHGEDACGIIPELDSAGKSIKKRTSRKAQERTTKENNIVAAYETFLNGLETIVERVKTLTTENPDFAEFVKTVERQPECKREKFLDLLIRPVQRWPSIVNILKSYSDECEKLATKLENRCNGTKDDTQLQKEAAQVRLGAQDALRVSRFIQDSLMQMNESKHQTAQICEALKTQSVIEDIPAMYWSKKYTLSHQCDATLIGVSESYPQTAGQKSLKNVEVVCFLFSHGLEIARKKVGKNHAKPYKHIAFIHFDNMNAIMDSLDASLKRYLEIVFREQRKNYAISESEADTVSLGGGSDLVQHSEYTEERILLDLKDVASKEGFLRHMEQVYKTFERIERISVSDRKEGVRTESLLLNLPSGSHGTTPVTQLARSLSNVPDISTPKKLTRSFSNLIKKSFQIGNKPREEQPTSSSPSNSNAGPLSRSRHTALPRCMSSSCADSSSGASATSKYRLFSSVSLSPLNRRMNLLVLNTLSSVMPSATTTTSSATYSFEPESNRRHQNNKNLNNHHTESFLKSTPKVSVDPTASSPVKLKAISTLTREPSADIVISPEQPLPINNGSGANSNRTKNALNNNPNRNHNRPKEKKKSKRKSSNF